MGTDSLTLDVLSQIINTKINLRIQEAQTISISENSNHIDLNISPLTTAPPVPNL